MVDDILSILKCSSSTIATNAATNSFMELNKLKLSHTKCGKIHIGKNCDKCPKLFVHEESMRETHEEHYLEDIISEKGTLDATITERKLKGYSYISEIRALLSDMPFGHTQRYRKNFIFRDWSYSTRIYYIKKKNDVPAEHPQAPTSRIINKCI